MYGGVRCRLQREKLTVDGIGGEDAHAYTQYIYAPSSFAPLLLLRPVVERSSVTGEEKASEGDRENKREKGRAIGGEGGEGEVEEKVA